MSFKNRYIQQQKKPQNLLRLPWTSQGLNLGPPDYEPQKVTFSDSLRYVTILMFNELYAHDFHKNSLNTPN